MKRLFTLLILLIILLMLPACTKHSALICDRCGIAFEGDDDYSKQLARDEEIRSALGIDLYRFYCPDCQDELGFGTAISYCLMSEEDLARLEAYDAGIEVVSTPQIDENVVLLQSTNTDPYYVARDIITGLYGIYDVSNNAWEGEPVFSDIGTFDSDEIALAKKNDFYGYIDPKGNTVIGFQFLEADSFFNGVARVCINKWGVIDTTGAFVIDPMYEGITVYENNYISIYDGEGYGLCNPNGEIIIEPKFLEGFKFSLSRIYACTRIDSQRSWYKLFDYEGNSLMDAFTTENVQYVSYPYDGTHIVCYEHAESGLNFYYVHDENLNILFGDACGYISDFSSFGYAVVLPTPSVTRSWTNWELDVEGIFVIDKAGTRICQLPDLPSYDTRYSRGGGEWRYNYDFYVNEYCTIAMNDSSGYLINLQTLECSQWKRAIPIEDSNYVMVQDKNTELWSFYDGNNLIEANCTNIKYSDSGMSSQFKLYHGDEYIIYPS
ncbi:MAG: WG repeat-containing protein [Clostridiales bacterium]|nr:WG repeat-containing protein [Clostridiales bacterium]